MARTNNPGDKPTNRPTGNPQPGAGPEWPDDATRLEAPDDHGGGGGVNPEAVRAGREPDVFAVKPILSIPAAVVVTFVIAFTVTTLVFLYFSNVPSDPLANPYAVDRNKAPLNQRLERIGREKDGQPRLEPLQVLENDGQFITQPPLPRGNSPEYHPEDLRPDVFPGLQQSGWVEKDKTARIPIEDAMKLPFVPGHDAIRGTLFPVSKTPSAPTPTTDRPTAANAGRGAKTHEPPADKTVEKKDH